MSAESNQSSGSESSLLPPTASQQSTQTLSSEEEGSGGQQEESPVEEPASSDEEEYLEEDERLGEETYLDGKDHLYKQEHLQEEEHLQKEKGPEGRDYLAEEECLERGFKRASSSQMPPNLNARSPAAGVSGMTAFLTAPPPISEPAGKSPYDDMMPSTSFVKDDGEFLDCQDQGTQTEWIYETKAPVKSRLKAEKESSAPALPTLKSDVEGRMVTELQEEEKGTFWSEPIDMRGAEDLDGHLSSSSYQLAFRTMMEEMAAHGKLDPDIPLPGHETRRKLGLLMKKKFEKYKKTILWIMKKHENLPNPKASDTSTLTFHLWNQSPHVEEPRVEKAQEPHRLGPQEKQLDIDTEWGKSKVKVPPGDAKILLYPNESIFQILFPDGSGQIHYPSGHLAVLILGMNERAFTQEYIVMEDGKNGCVRALINNAGHATFHDENGEIWLSLSQNLGYYFAKGKPQKTWNWWDLNLHVHAPPVQPISLNINQYIKVQIRRQDEITFHFAHHTKHVCLNLGTRYKFVAPEALREMKKAAILEVEVGATARKVHVLLGEMSKILRFLTVSDLEDFLGATKTWQRTACVRGNSRTS